VKRAVDVKMPFPTDFFADLARSFLRAAAGLIPMALVTNIYPPMTATGAI
jgi:hypothetical protein